MHIAGVTELEGTWQQPKELVVTVGGQEMARGAIVGFRIDRALERCSNDLCPGCIEDEVVLLAFKLPPPRELP